MRTAIRRPLICAGVYAGWVALITTGAAVVDLDGGDGGRHGVGLAVGVVLIVAAAVIPLLLWWRNDRNEGGGGGHVLTVVAVIVATCVAPAFAPTVYLATYGTDTPALVVEQRLHRYRLVHPADEAPIGWFDTCSSAQPPPDGRITVRTDPNGWVRPQTVSCQEEAASMRRWLTVLFLVGSLFLNVLTWVAYRPQP